MRQALSKSIRADSDCDSDTTQRTIFRSVFCKSKISHFCSGLAVALAFTVHFVWPVADARHGRATSLPLPQVHVFFTEQPVMPPQDVIVRENARAWQEALERIHDGLPSEAKPPQVFSDLVSRSRAVCKPGETVSFDDRTIPCWLVEAVVHAAIETGTDAVYLMALADKESSFRTDAEARTSSARGLFQFLSGTWLELVRDYGARHNLATEAEAIETVNGKPSIEDPKVRKRVMALRDNPYVAAVMAGEMLKRDAAKVERKLGRELDRSEYYFTHFLGASNASRLIEAKEAKPSVKASGLLPGAARANRSLFTSRQGRKYRPISVAEFHERIEDMMEQRIERYGEIEQTVLAQSAASD